MFRKFFLVITVLFLIFPFLISADCFLPGTLIEMANGEKKPIEKVEVGDEIAGYDLEKRRKTINIVEELESPIKPWAEIYLENGIVLKTTDDHPFYVKELKDWASFDPDETYKNGEYLKVQQLKIGHSILTLEEDYIKIVAFKYYPEEVQTYNLKKVTNNNTFFADGVLAHNRWWETCSVGTQSSYNWTGQCSSSCGIGTESGTLTTITTSYDGWSSCQTSNSQSSVSRNCIGTNCSGSSRFYKGSASAVTLSINKSNYSSSENINVSSNLSILACANDNYAFLNQKVYTDGGRSAVIYNSYYHGGGTYFNTSSGTFHPELHTSWVYSASASLTAPASAGNYNVWADFMGSARIPYTVTVATPINYSCTGTLPSNATMCSGDNTGLTSSLAWQGVGTSSASCTTSRKCEYYTTPTTYSCTGTLPSNATMCSGDNTGLTSSLAWQNVGTSSSSCTTSRKCEYYIIPTCTASCGSWSSCSVSCGGGTQSRTCTNTNCSTYSQTRDCNPQACCNPSCGNPLNYCSSYSDGCTAGACTGTATCSGTQCYDNVYTCSGAGSMTYTTTGDYWQNICGSSSQCGYFNSPNDAPCNNSENCNKGNSCGDDSSDEELRSRCSDTTTVEYYTWGKVDRCTPGSSGGCSAPFIECETGTVLPNKVCEVGYVCRENGTNAECVAKSSTWTEI